MRPRDRTPRIGAVGLALRLAFLVLLAVAVGSAPGTVGATGSPVAWTLAGTGTQGDSGDGGQAREADINQPRSIFATSDGGFLWAEPWSNRVRRVWPDGHISTIAGTGVAGYSGDGGLATQAQLNFVHSAAPTADGGYLIADTQNSVIRKISPAGVITTVAGTGFAGYSGDGGPARQAQINNPRGVVAMPDGGFLFPDTNNQRVRRVWPDGTITTVAGTGVQGFSGDGGPATAAQFSVPFGVAPMADSGFLIVDAVNQRIRKVSVSGVVTTVAGTGVGGYLGDGGPATNAQINNPHNVVATPDGGFYIADASNERVRYVAPDGTITTVIGNGVRAYTGDGGPASQAQISVPKAVGLDASGNLMIAEEQNNRIRFVGTVVAPSNLSLPAISGTPSQGQTLTTTAGGWSGTGPTFAYQWRRCDSGGAACADIPGAVSKTYILAAADAGATIRSQVTATNSAGSAVATSSATSPSGAALIPPSNVTPPSISGMTADGQTLTASTGTWSGTTPMTFTYQWQRCNTSGTSCVAVAGATSSTYLVSAADIGSTLRVVVTATNGAGSSAYPGVIAADSPLSYWRLGETGGTATDSSGFANGTYVGSPQQAVSGLLTGDTNGAVTLNGTSQYVEVPANSAWTPSSFSFEILVKASSLPDNRTIAAAQGLFTGWWLNTGSSGSLRFFIGDGSAWRFAAAGPTLAVGSTYDIAVTYDGSLPRLYVNGTLSSTGPTVSMASNSGANALRLGSASSFVGQYWPGTIDDASFFSSTLAAGQISSHYTASQGGSAGSTAASAQSAVVVAVAPSNSAVPVVSGLAQEGQTLSASSGSWSGSAPIGYAYQWQRCGGSCVNVGSNQNTYVVVSADVGSKLQVVVTASNSAGSASATSAQTATVTSQPTSGTVTFTMAASGDDGDAAVSSPTSSGYPPTGTAAINTSGGVFTAGRRLAYGNYQVIVPLLRFDTSTLPAGATVTSATLKLYVTTASNADNRNLVAEWANGATWPLAASDWSLNSSASALSGSAISSIATGTVNSFNLTGLANISGSGYTTLRLHVDGGAPAGDNLVQFASYDNSSAYPKPQLVLTWTKP